MKKAVAVTFAALTMGLGGTVSALAADLARYEPACRSRTIATASRSVTSPAISAVASVT